MVVNDFDSEKAVNPLLRCFCGVALWVVDSVFPRVPYYPYTGSLGVDGLPPNSRVGVVVRGKTLGEIEFVLDGRWVATFDFSLVEGYPKRVVWRFPSRRGKHLSYDILRSSNQSEFERYFDRVVGRFSKKKTNHLILAVDRFLLESL